jgi:hypothetical protein
MNARFVAVMERALDQERVALRRRDLGAEDRAA